MQLQLKSIPHFLIRLGFQLLTSGSVLCLIALPTLAEVQSQSSAPPNPDVAQSAGIEATDATAFCPCELELKILNLNEDDVLDAPSGIIVLSHDARKTVELRVNGEVVEETLIGRRENDDGKGISRSTWYGVPLQSGKNTVTATTNDGETKIVTVMVRGKPQRLTVSTVETRIPADGRSVMTVTGQLLDEAGNLTNRNTLVTVSANGGEFVGEDGDRLQDGFQVEAQDGKFTAQLRSGLKAQRVQIRAAVGSGPIGSTPLEAFTQAEFETSLRPSIATGVISLRLGGEGNDFYGKLRDFLPLDGDNDFTADLKGQAFAMGAVGDWLLTGAYNSDRNLNESCDETNRLFRASDPCDNDYPTYGDGSRSEILTPSLDSLYLKFERTSPVARAGTDSFLWGDYKTDQFARRSQQFTALTRELHGFSGNYNWDNLQISGFFGNNVQGFQRDTISPDGTSGYYFLSRRLLLEGSEDVFVELEELDRPGTVLQRIPLLRGQDYTIDYDRGTLLFTDPVLRTDISAEGFTLVRRIVATYQYDDGGSDNKIYGGRLQYNFSRDKGRETWLAGTYLREDKGSRDYSLFGLDTLISLGDRGTLVGEYARSDNDSEILGNVEGSAYRFELDGELTDSLLGRAYYRHADTGFSNNATVSFVPGQTRYGAQLNASIADRTQLRFQYDHEKNEGNVPQPRLTFGDLFDAQEEATPGVEVDNSLTTISAGVLQKIGPADVSVDWVYRDRNDNKSPGIFDENSQQLRSRLLVPLNDRLSFLAQNETTLSADVDPVFSDRTLLGLNWKVWDGVNAQLAQQFFHRGQYAGKQITSLNVTGDYNLSRDTLLRGRYTVLNGAEDLQMQGAVGIQHNIPINPHLKADLTFERVFGNLLGDNAAADVFAQPFAFGQSAAALGIPDGTSYSGGLTYATDRVQAKIRYERRNSPQGNNQVLTAAAGGKINDSLTGLFNYKQARAANQTLENLGTTAYLKAGLAYRNPQSDKFNALLRYEYRKNPSTIPDSILFGSGTGYHEHLFGVEALYTPNWQWEFFGKLALRNSVSFLADDLVGSSTVTLAQGRVSYKFAQRWDATGEFRWLNQGSANYGETGFLGELGYYVNPNLRLAGGYSLGRASDRDFDGSRTVGGPYFGVSLKLDNLFQGFGLQNWPEPAFNQPASVEPNINPTPESTPESTSESTPESPDPFIENLTPETPDERPPVPQLEPQLEPFTPEESASPTGENSGHSAPVSAPVPALW